MKKLFNKFAKKACSQKELAFCFLGRSLSAMVVSCKIGTSNKNGEAL